MVIKILASSGRLASVLRLKSFIRWLVGSARNFDVGDAELLTAIIRVT